MNTVCLTGRIANDFEIKTTAEGVPVTSFGLAVKRPRAKDQTDFVDCVLWRQSAEFAGKYLHKGDLIGIVGQLQSRSYETRDGSKRFVTEVLCDRVEGLKSAESTSGGTNTQNTAQKSYKQTQMQTYIPDGYVGTEVSPELAPLPDDDDLPF